MGPERRNHVRGKSQQEIAPFVRHPEQRGEGKRRRGKPRTPFVRHLQKTKKRGAEIPEQERWVKRGKSLGT